MKKKIFSTQTYSFRSIVNSYRENFADLFQDRPPFLRYAKIQPPLAVSMWTVQNQNGFFMTTDRDGSYSIAWDTDSLDQLSRSVPFKRKYHSHDYFELVYVLQGNVDEWIEEQCIHLKRGDCILLDKNIRHVEDYPEKDKAACCVFLLISDECVRTLSDSELPCENSQSVLRFLLSHMDNEKTTLKSFCHFRAVHADTESIPAVEAGLNAILTELTSKEAGFVLMVQGHLLRILSILENPKEYRQLSTFSSIGPKEDLIAQISLLMEASMGVLHKKELAERMGYNAAYLCRLIKENMGKSFTDYRLCVRLKNAETLLSDTRLSIAEICEKLQFSNRSYFYRTFEAAVGMTPGEFREIKQRNKR